MNTFYFNTGVKPWNCNGLSKGEVWKNGEKQIPFDCEAPENARFMFACDNPDLPESKYSSVKVFEIFNTSLCSKYAYFRIIE